MDNTNTKQQKFDPAERRLIAEARATYQAARQSAFAKLAALGLTDAEIKALIGA
jgi:hypothetical protein